ncbi:MAG: glycosyltransferase family 4 protein [Prochlorococcus marinus XMU1422]|nr:glycosyltransferase family 4 protein [Prochlorococcus marinus XMU1421]MBO7013249.1 glycosyltransferase family 4 protein [Prochlorococcus marinus XMU1422]MCR8542296.1 glycosyltransferase [Prochlorococcus marinus XMU1423]
MIKTNFNKNIIYHSTWIEIYPGGGEACDLNILKILSNLSNKKILLIGSITNIKFFNFFKSTYKFNFFGKFIRDIFQFLIIFNSINLYLRKYKLKIDKNFILFYSGRIGGLYLLTLFRPNLQVIYNVHGLCNKYFFKKLYKKNNIKFIFWGRAEDNIINFSLKKKKEKFITLIPSSNNLKLFKKNFYEEYPLLKINNQKKKLTLIWIGRLEPIKNPMRLIEIAEKNPKILIYIVGNGSLMKKLKTKIQTRKLLNLKIFGHLDNQKIKKLIDKSDFHLMTSQSENYPLVIQEAMANRMISIVPNISCFNKLDFPNLNFYEEDNLLNNKIIKANWDSKLEESAYRFFENHSEENNKKLIKKLINFF